MGTGVGINNFRSSELGRVTNVVDSGFTPATAGTQFVDVQKTVLEPAVLKFFMGFQTYAIDAADTYKVEIIDYWGAGENKILEQGFLASILAFGTMDSTNDYISQFYRMTTGRVETVRFTITTVNAITKANLGFACTNPMGILVGDAKAVQLNRIAENTAAFSGGVGGLAQESTLQSVDNQLVIIGTDIADILTETQTINASLPAIGALTNEMYFTAATVALTVTAVQAALLIAPLNTAVVLNTQYGTEIGGLAAYAVVTYR